MAAPVVGIENQTDSIKAKVEAGLVAAEWDVSGLSYSMIKTKELVGEYLFRQMVQKRLKDSMIKSHGKIVYMDMICSKE